MEKIKGYDLGSGSGFITIDDININVYTYKGTGGSNNSCFERTFFISKESATVHIKKEGFVISKFDNGKYHLHFFDGQTLQATLLLSYETVVKFKKHFVIAGSKYSQSYYSYNGTKFK